MDMIFRHDQCRVHIGHAPATYLKHMVHIVIRKSTSPDFYGSLLISIDDVPTSWYVAVMSIARAQHESKAKILDAALRVIRTKGYSATTIDDICLSAGLTKGSFFHHFKSKEELALAAAAHFAAVTDDLFATAPYRSLPDPRDRVIGYVSFRKAILNRALPESTCLLGTMVQETYETHPAIRKVCDKHISAHAAAIERDITEAKRICAPEAEWSPQGLALFTQAVIQGAFVLAKAKHGPEIAIECLDHLQWYLETQFTPTTK
jgi:TetR/AcrR family transcriptional repressor of nem operon